MFRTRDFLLLFVTIVFLLVGIGGTSIVRMFQGPGTGQMVKFTETGDIEYVVEVEEPAEISREEKLAQMREKIKADTNLQLTVAESTVSDEEEEEKEIDNNHEGEANLCSNYRLFSGVWPLSGVKTETAEGARLFYIETLGNPDGPTSSAMTLEREILLQLPVRSYSDSGNYCLASDVIGIAKDGSLIRNSEVLLYSVFGADTVVGYALDGLPIYGLTTETLDTCGGKQGVSGYGYSLSSGAKTIINCFSSSPVSI